MTGPSDMPQAPRQYGGGLINLGLMLCLAGVFALGFASSRGGGPMSPVGMGGLGAIAAGWVLFGYVIYRRARYVRAQQSKG